MEALTFRLRGLEESSLVITKAETQQIIGSIGSIGSGVGVGLEPLDIKDKELNDSKENVKECHKWNPYERYGIIDGRRREISIESNLRKAIKLIAFHM